MKRVPIVFIEIVAGIAVTSDDMIAIVDSVRPSVYVINPVSIFYTVKVLFNKEWFLKRFLSLPRSMAFAASFST